MFTPRQAHTERGRQTGSGAVATAWYGPDQKVGFIAYHTTEEGRVFVDRVQTVPELRRSGIGSNMIKSVVGHSKSELQVRRDNNRAVTLYRKLGYTEAEEGEYELQNKRRRKDGTTVYMHMRTDEVVVRGTSAQQRHEVICVGGARAEDVPGDMWGWMVREVRAEDNTTEKVAARILAGEDTRVRYAVAVVRVAQQGRREVRNTLMQRYDETRRNTPRVTPDQIRAQTVQKHAKFGWRLYEAIQWHPWREKER